MGVSPKLLLLRITGEVVAWVDGLVKKSNAVKVVIHGRRREIPRSVAQEDAALIIVPKLFFGKAYCSIFLCCQRRHISNRRLPASQSIFPALIKLR